MIQDYLLPKELALLAVEKGFSQRCIGFMMEDGLFILRDVTAKHASWPAITFDQVKDWLKQNNIHVTTDYFPETDRYFHQVYFKKQVHIVEEDLNLTIKYAIELYGENK